MKLKVLLLVLFVGVLNLNAQKKYFPADKETGMYHALNNLTGLHYRYKRIPPANNKYAIQFKTYTSGKRAGTQAAVLAITKGRMPWLLIYEDNLSDGAGKCVFIIPGGAMFIRYDENSFAYMYEDDAKKTHLNFFSKDKAKVDTMTEQKVMDYVLKTLQ